MAEWSSSDVHAICAADKTVAETDATIVFLLAQYGVMSYCWVCQLMRHNVEHTNESPQSKDKRKCDEENDDSRDNKRPRSEPASHLD